MFKETYETFDYKSYYRLYKDIKHLTSKQKLWNHWMKNGKKEGRIPCFYFKQSTNNFITKNVFERKYVIYLTRHMRSIETSNYWIHNYNSIRKFYKKILIIVIDDNSMEEFMNQDESIKMNDTGLQIIYTHLKTRGELLPYYYFLKNSNNCTHALIIHDSVFLQKEIHNYIDNVNFIPLWCFHKKDALDYLNNEIKQTVNCLRNKDMILNLLNSNSNWEGVFGAMSIISHKFLITIENKFKFSNLLKTTFTREKRMCFERILPLLVRSMNNSSISLQGNIKLWCFKSTIYEKTWNISWYEYQTKYKKDARSILFKIWTGR